MLFADLSSIVGTKVLGDLRLDALVRADDALATYAATGVSDGTACTVRVAGNLRVTEQQVDTLGGALERISRHVVGIRTICQPRAAGSIRCGSDLFLAVAHVGTPHDNAEDRIAAGPPMDLHEVVRVLSPAADALFVLHNQGLVHGAVHPGAIRLASEGAVLSAYGLHELASLLGGAVAARDVLPLRSRTPEQVGIVAALPSMESDTYGFAMVACELLAGRVFTAENDPGAVARAIDHPMVRPTPGALSVHVPESAERAFRVALSAQPRERTSNPKQLLAALAAPPAPSTGEHDKEPMEPAPVRRHGRRTPDVERAAELRNDPQSLRSVFETHQAPQPASPTTRSGAWFVYAIVALGVLLLTGGVTALFVVQQGRRPPAIAPPTAAPPPLPPPTGSVGLPDDDGEPEPASIGAPSASAAASSSASPQLKAVAPELALYPDDTTALIPIAKETPVLGSRDALATIVLFADMQCPYTRRARIAIETLMTRHGNSLRVAVRHRPIPSHDQAERAAEIAATAGALAGPQVFWRLFTTLTDNQVNWTPGDMIRWAKEVGAPAAALERALDTHRYQEIVDADHALAARLMVRATPTLFVNGKRIDGIGSVSQLDAIVASEIGAARALLAKGAPRAKLYSARVRFHVTSADADSNPTGVPPRRP